MKVIALRGDVRSDLGKSATKALRKKGLVPCVSYGGNGEPQHFSVYQSDFSNLVYTPNTYLVMLNVDGGQRLCKLQELQFHPVSEEIMHADFHEIDINKPVDISVPIQIEGVSPGVRGGGKLQVKMKKLRVLSDVKSLPEFITVNIDTLDIGKGIRVRDVEVSGYKLLDTPENTIVSCIVTRAAKAAEAAEGEDGEEVAETEEAEA